METTTEDPNLSVESRQAYLGPSIGNNNLGLIGAGLNAYGNLNQGYNARYGQNSFASPLVGNGVGGNRYSNQAISKRRFSNMGGLGNQIGGADYPTGIGNGGGITGAGDENGITSTGSDQSQSQDYLDSYSQLAAGGNLLSGTGGRGNGLGNQLGGFGTANNLGAGNNQLLVGNRRTNIANRRNGNFGYGGGLGNGGGGLGGTGLGATGYPSAYGGLNGPNYAQQLAQAGVRSSGYGGSGYGGKRLLKIVEENPLKIKNYD